MCNRLHFDSKPIKKSGKGWKLFRKNGSLFGLSYYRINDDGWITWIDNMHGTDYCDGFCFLPNKKEAIRLLKKLNEKTHHNVYKNCEIKQIYYQQGLGKHLENKITRNIDFLICICKKFKIVED